MKRKVCVVVLVAMGFLLVGSFLFAEGQSEEGEEIDFPTKPIQMVVPWAAGGGTDAVARVLASEAESILGTSINVVNRTGGSGAVGHNTVAQAKPDGYTTGLTTIELIIQPHVQEVPYSYTDLQPVLQVNSDPAAITVRADSDWETLDEFIAYAKDHPGELRGSGTGWAGIWHLALLELQQETGTEFTFVPSRGAAPAVTELLGGHIELVSCSPPEVAAQLEAGELRMLAVSGDERHPNYPDVPTMSELGYDVGTMVWRGIQVPDGTPDAVVQILHDAFKQAYESESFKETMNNLGLGMAYKGPEDYAAMIESDYEAFGNLVDEFDLEEGAEEEGIE